MRALHWGERAIGDMASIERHIARDNPVGAHRFLAQVEAKVLPLTLYPDIGRAGIAGGTRELVVHAHYVVIYRVLADRIHILRVKHVARRWPVSR